MRDARKRARTAWLVGLSAVSVWTLSIIAAPIAADLGLTTVSSAIYQFYGLLCHQIPDRSFYVLEHHFAVCSRCFGVYFGLVLGFVIYPLIRKIEEIEPFSRIWLFLSLVPIGIDWSLGVFGVWDNSHLSRFLTGSILGIACAVFIIPGIVEIGQNFSHKKRGNQVPG